MNYMKQFKILVITLLLLLFTFSMPIIIIDPIFHYHKPLDNLNYRLGNTRYFNNGISKFFDYDTIITGSSMTRNFKTSEIDELWGVNSVKLTYSSATIKELSENIRIAIKSNDEIKYIIFGLDTDRLEDDQNHYLYSDIPFYLYDNNIFNDVEYLFNKEIFFDETLSVLENTSKGIEMQTFDVYDAWGNSNYLTGIDGILADYTRKDTKSELIDGLSEELREKIYVNINENLISIIEENPDIKFIFFYPPYSIAWFDKVYMNGTIISKLEGLEYTTSLLLNYDNVEIHSFFNEYGLITDFNNYRDITHYLPEINSQILIWINNKDHILTTDTFKKHFSEIEQFYLNYNYDDLW